MRKKGILIVGLALMIAAAGVVYAHWEETLTVDVNVVTGDIDPAWSLGTPATSDNAAGNPAPTTCDLEYCDPNTTTGADPSGPGMSPTRYTKAVASCEAEIVGNELQVNITNGYPSYYCTVSADLHNLGSVPVKMQDLSFTRNPAIDVTFSGNTEFMACGYQLDPGDVVFFEINLHINNSALENDDLDYPVGGYTVDMGLTWYNWNEYDAAACDGPTDVSGGMLTGGGWWGWSCPAGSIVVGGYFEIPAGSTFTVGGEGPAYPGAPAVGGYNYPVYPHYTYGAGEQGYVGFAGTYGQARIHALCLP